MKPIADVPESYLQWILNQKPPKGFDEDVRHTAMTELQRRRDAGGAFDDDSEDDQDAEIARRRIEEIVQNPDSVIRDKRLEEKLKEWQS